MTYAPTKPSAKAQKLMDALRQFGLALPETREDFPWGHSALKVGKKAFVFLYADAEGVSMSVKLKRSHFDALAMPFAQPTGYGLGKHGWVSAVFAPKDKAPVGILEQWIEESYRLIAPKKTVKQLDARASKVVQSKTKAKPVRTKARKSPATKSA